MRGFGGSTPKSVGGSPLSSSYFSQSRWNRWFSACFRRMMTPHQCRAARALLDWSQEELAEKAGVGLVTVRHLEAGRHEPRRATLDVIRRALEAAAVEFIDENGGGASVRLRKRRPRKGSKGRANGWRMPSAPPSTAAINRSAHPACIHDMFMLFSCCVQ